LICIYNFLFLLRQGNFFSEGIIESFEELQRNRNGTLAADSLTVSMRASPESLQAGTASSDDSSGESSQAESITVISDSNEDSSSDMGTQRQCSRVSASEPGIRPKKYKIGKRRGIEDGRGSTRQHAADKVCSSVRENERQVHNTNNLMSSWSSDEDLLREEEDTDLDEQQILQTTSPNIAREWRKFVSDKPTRQARFRDMERRPRLVKMICRRALSKASCKKLDLKVCHVLNLDSTSMHLKSQSLDPSFRRVQS
jgi:hypothetical protein